MQGGNHLQLNLVRLAVISFQTGIDSFKMFISRVGDAEVQSLGYFHLDGNLGIVVAATVPLRLSPLRTASGRVMIPNDARRRCENAIETVANVMSIAERCKRSISSLSNPVALVPLDREARDWLKTLTGIHGLLRTILSPFANLEVDMVVRSVADRLDGAALLAEALAHDHSTGRFHELLRVFERAFGLATSELVKPLATFLEGQLKFGYTELEVKKWLVTLRHPATHADSRPSFLLESDVREVIPRMEQAAHDVLFNKLHWRSRSTDRRTEWIPLTGTTSADGGVFAKQGSTTTLGAQIMDPFGAYPLHLNASVTLPSNWWTDPSGEIIEEVDDER